MQVGELVNGGTGTGAVPGRRGTRFPLGRATAPPYQGEGSCGACPGPVSVLPVCAGWCGCGPPGLAGQRRHRPISAIWVYHSRRSKSAVSDGAVNSPVQTSYRGRYRNMNGSHSATADFSALYPSRSVTMHQLFYIRHADPVKITDNAVF